MRPYRYAHNDNLSPLATGVTISIVGILRAGKNSVKV